MLVFYEDWLRIREVLLQRVPRNGSNQAAFTKKVITFHKKVITFRHKVFTYLSHKFCTMQIATTFSILALLASPAAVFGKLDALKGDRHFSENEQFLRRTKSKKSSKKGKYLTPINISIQPAYWALPIYLGVEFGWFEELGLDPTVQAVSVGCSLSLVQVCSRAHILG